MNSIELNGDFQDILPDTTWLKRWQKIPAASTAAPEIPPSACVTSTPLSPRAWTEMLASHSNQQLVCFFLDGISNGFRLGFNHTQSTLKFAGKNLLAAMAHPDIVIEYLQHEISLKRVAGPFPRTLLPDVHVSRFGVTPYQTTPPSEDGGTKKQLAIKH